MPCNPAIGGLGKGHLVKEIDALGGEMGRAIDAVGIQFRLLNRRKGPAVRSPRAQADKESYRRHMSDVVGSEPGLTVIPGEAVSLLIEKGDGGSRIFGVGSADGREHRARRVVLCAGTFLRGLMHVGEDRFEGGREGSAVAAGLSESLLSAGLELYRLKTGTPPRLSRDSIDFKRVTTQKGDDDPAPFSFRTRIFAPEQVSCHITHTNDRTHQLIRENLERSPLFGGVIEGTGPRYCPSIEDKVVRFADKTSHHVFLEPEGLASDEIYVNGLSSSLPADVQEGFIRTVVGLEEARIVRYGYAVEYDSVPSWQVGPSLETRKVSGLYLAGQILGTSGYEEAAAQGLVAGVNAAFSLQGEDPFLPRRDEGYLGVLIDDLVTKEISEPYRMFTSRAEHRLAMRCDNAEERMLPHAERLGLLPSGELDLLRDRVRAAGAARAFMAGLKVKDSGRSEASSRLDDTVRRNGSDIESIWALPVRNGDDEDVEGEIGCGEYLEREVASFATALSPRLVNEAVLQAATDIRYAGYISKQEKLLSRRSHLDELEIPEDFTFLDIGALSYEAREKLNRMRPGTLGRAARIDGVRQSDLAILAVMIRRHAELSGSNGTAAAETAMMPKVREAGE